MLREIRGVTFDGYGTLIDWGRGLSQSLTALLPRDLPAAPVPDELRRRWEAHIAPRMTEGYHSFRALMREATVALLGELGVDPQTVDPDRPARDLGRVETVADAKAALSRLQSRYRLALLGNVDDDLLRGTLVRLGAVFQHAVSAERAGAYKPAPAHFTLALKLLGLQAAQVLHVAASVAADLRPAQALGLRTAWVNRSGTPPPDGFAPDVQVRSLTELCDLLRT